MNYSECSDEMLVSMFRMKDETAIEVLFERYKQLVRKKRTAMFIIGGDSDDLIQEGMIGLYKAVRDYDETKDASFATFASMCVNRQIMSAVTASNRKKNQPLNNYLSFDVSAGEDEENDMSLLDVLVTDDRLNPEDMYIGKESENRILEQIKNALSPFEKQVLELYMEDKDYKEIAVILGKEAKSVDNAIQRIRTKVQKLLTK